MVLHTLICSRLFERSAKLSSFLPCVSVSATPEVSEIKLSDSSGDAGRLLHITLHLHSNRDKSKLSIFSHILYKVLIRC